MSWLEDEFLTRKIHLTHDPDDDHRVDCVLLLGAIENVICNATPEITSQLSLQVCNQQTGVTNMCNTGRIELEETVRSTLLKIRHEILHRCYENQDLHTQAMFLLEMLEHFRWDAKVALVLAAFGMSYGEFWLIVQSKNRNPLATQISALKNLNSSLGMLRKPFKALTLMINVMLEVSRTITELESLPLQHEFLDYKALAEAKAKIYMATYWIFRSSITCCSLIAGLRTIKHDQVYSSVRKIGTVTFSRLVQNLNTLSSDLKEQLYICHPQIETRLLEKLVNLFKETHVDNQEVLRVLFALKDGCPFKSSSPEKCGIDKLKDKVVILLISKPELLPVQKIFWLVLQIHDHPERRRSAEEYAIIWVPTLSSHAWNHADEISYQFLSNSLPFFSVRQPWLLNPVVVNYIKQQWNFQEEPMMVVLDVNGTVTNSNALDMVWIWGAKAFPFSTSRERDLWEQETSSLQLIVHGINTSLTNWVEEGKTICIYASDDLEWIRRFSIAVKEIKSAGIQLEVVYVGWRNPGENIRNIADTINQEHLSASLCFTETCFFWLRIESIMNSISRLKDASSFDGTVDEVSGLLDTADNNKGFAIIGTGLPSDVVKLQGERIRECFDFFPVWAGNVATMGLATAIRNALELSLPDRLSQESNFVPYDEVSRERISICSKCRRPMEKIVVYRCNVAE